MGVLLKILVLCQIALPLRHIRLTSGYGNRMHPLTGRYAFHQGIDLAARHDTVFSILPGKVRKTGYDPLLGVYIVLDHGLYHATYGHLSRLLILPGDSVRQGDPIAVTGLTGRITGEHLHFTIRYKHQFINPLAFLYAVLTNSKHHE